VRFYNATLGSTNLGASSSASVGGGLFSVLSQLEFNNSRVLGNLANAFGGAMYLVYSNDLSVVNSEISGNIAGSSGGGGIYANNFLGSCVLNNTRIVSNTSYSSAGGIYWASIDTLKAENGTEISYNFASNNFGGVWLSVPGTLVFRDTDISHNTALNGIGGIGSTGAGKVDLIDCNINYNSGDSNGFCGGLFLWGSSGTLLAENRDCEIIGNMGVNGGGILVQSGSSLILNAPTSHTYTIANNHAINSGGGLCCDLIFAAGVYGNVLFSGNEAKLGGGIAVSNDSVLTLGPTNGYAPVIFDNTAYLSGGGLWAGSSNTVVNLTDVEIGLQGMGNKALLTGAGADIGGGGAAVLYDAQLNAVNCKFQDNISSNCGGGLLALSATLNIGSDFTSPGSMITPPSVFANNHVPIYGSGGGLLIFNSSAKIADAMIVSNSAYYSGGGIISGGSQSELVNVVLVQNSVSTNAPLWSGDGIVSGPGDSLRLTQCTIADNDSVGILLGSVVTSVNCIVWGHSVSQIWLAGGGGFDAEFSDIEGGWPGPFNISTNPAFVETALLDYRLTYVSPCINAGATLGTVTNDCIGTPRPLGGGWDIGAYEFFGEAIIQVSPPVWDFGDVAIGDTEVLMAFVNNVGTLTLTGDVTNVNVPFSVFGPSHYELNPLNSTSVVFHFTPVAEVTSSNTVTFTGGGGANVLLTGTGIPEPGLFIINYLLFIIYYLRNKTK